MTKKEREEIIKENSIIMNLASDLDFPWLKDDIKEVPPEDECTEEELDYPDDEDNADEYADRYEENEDQSDMPDEEEKLNIKPETPTVEPKIKTKEEFIKKVKEYQVKAIQVPRISSAKTKSLSFA